MVKSARLYPNGLPTVETFITVAYLKPTARLPIRQLASIRFWASSLFPYTGTTEFGTCWLYVTVDHIPPRFHHGGSRPLLFTGFSLPNLRYHCHRGGTLTVQTTWP